MNKDTIITSAAAVSKGVSALIKKYKLPKEAYGIFAKAYLKEMNIKTKLICKKEK